MTAIQECGLAGWLVALATFITIPIAVVALALALGRKRVAVTLAGLALSTSMLPFSIGALGEWRGRAQVDGALAGGAIDPAHADGIREIGYAEAAQCKRLGAGGSAPPAVVAAVALGLALLRRGGGAPPQGASG